LYAHVVTGRPASSSVTGAAVNATWRTGAPARRRRASTD
jgi:hypothetical protein